MTKFRLSHSEVVVFPGVRLRCFPPVIIYSKNFKNKEEFNAHRLTSTIFFCVFCCTFLFLPFKLKFPTITGHSACCHRSHGNECNFL